MAIGDFAGAVAVVTGGASGIGLATAHALHAAGAHVVLGDIQGERLEQARAEVSGRGAPEAEVAAVVTDVTDEAQVVELMRRAEAITGRVDLVVASAGVGNGGAIDMFSAAQMRSLLDINVMGVYHCVQAALPTMRRQGSGHFVFLSSVAGKIGSPLLSGYCASKWAVRGMAHALRSEFYGTGIDITTVFPAWVDTPMAQQESVQQLGHVQALLTADEVAAAILQAAREGRHDLTLAPNPDIALMLRLMRDDPDQAEALSGAAFQRRTQRQAEQRHG